MSQLERLFGAMASTPTLPGARCAGRWELFDSTIGVRGGRPKAELECARSSALSLCETCPALVRCQAWFDTLRLKQRPRGVVAGRVVCAAGRVLVTDQSKGDA